VSGQIDIVRRFAFLCLLGWEKKEALINVSTKPNTGYSYNSIIIGDRNKMSFNGK
jgi:hypothetical protein